MCILSGSYGKLGTTQYFGALLTDSQKQMTVMSNAIEHAPPSQRQDGKSVILIQPIPLYGGNVKDIQLIDVIPTFFTTLKHHLVPDHPLPARNNVLEIRPSAALPDSAKLQRCGPYVCSLLSSLEQLLDLEEEDLPLNDHIKDCMQRHYTSGFAFLVCKLDDNINLYHPIGYTHPANPDGNIVFPTTQLRNDEFKRQMAFDWNHVFYVVSKSSTLDFIHDFRPEQIEFSRKMYRKGADGLDIRETLSHLSNQAWWSNSILWEDLKQCVVTDGSHANVDACVRPLTSPSLFINAGGTSNAEAVEAWETSWKTGKAQKGKVNSLQEFSTHSQTAGQEKIKLECTIEQKEMDLKKEKKRVQELEKEMKIELTKEEWHHWKEEKACLVTKIKSLEVETNVCRANLSKMETKMQSYCMHPEGIEIDSTCSICNRKREPTRLSFSSYS